MKFLLVNHEYPPVGGGAATACREIAHNLSELGHEVAVLTSRYGNLPGHATEDRVIIHRAFCVRQRIDRSNLFEMFTFVVAALSWLPWVLITHRPDVLIVFFSLPSGPIGLAANLFAGLPYIVSLRGGDVPGLVPELDQVHKLIAPLRRWILKRAAAVVANSEGLRQLSERVDRFPVQVIPNGVDSNFFQPNSKADSDQLRILFVGRFQKQKNLAFFFEQLALLPPHTFEVHLVGDGPEKKNLCTLARELGIEAAIVWHGWLARSALLRIYQSANCLVNPALYEGLPNVVLEAMACSLPVIASNVPGNSELVIHDQTGFLFDLNDPGSLVRALTHLQDVDLRLRMGARGRARVLCKFSWPRVAESYVQLARAGC